MDTFPQDPRQIRMRIRSDERSLRQEQKRFGCIRDGSGKRYLLGPLSLLMGDTEGALKSFAWFAQTFPDDSGEPLHLLCWTLALYLAGKEAQALATLRQTMLSNLSPAALTGHRARRDRHVASLQLGLQSVC